MLIAYYSTIVPTSQERQCDSHVSEERSLYFKSHSSGSSHFLPVTTVIVGLDSHRPKLQINDSCFHSSYFVHRGDFPLALNSVILSKAIS